MTGPILRDMIDEYGIPFALWMYVANFAGVLAIWSRVTLLLNKFEQNDVILKVFFFSAAMVVHCAARAILPE